MIKIKGEKGMKITGNNILKYGNILKEYVNNKMPTKVALSIAYNAMILEPLFKIVEQARVNVLNEYGKRDSDNNLIINHSTNTVEIAPENVDIVNRKVGEIFSEEFECKDFKKVALDDFLLINEIKPNDVIKLEFMINDN
jgi:hypothetical protein